VNDTLQIQTPQGLPILAKQPASEDFNEVIRRTGHPTAVCEFCGRKHFEDDPNLEWETGEYEELKAGSQREPEKFLIVDQVSCGYINGKEGVIGCPCNWGRKYEDFIWNHRATISQYIAARVKKIVENALRDEGLSDQTKADLEMEEKAIRQERCMSCLRFVSTLAIDDRGICLDCQEQEKAQQRAQDRDALRDMGMRVRDDDDDNVPF
jgi:hypothetical protein